MQLVIGSLTRLGSDGGFDRTSNSHEARKPRESIRIELGSLHAAEDVQSC